MQCPKCQSENREGAEFCKRCGRSLQPDIVCPQCGPANTPPRYSAMEQQSEGIMVQSEEGRQRGRPRKGIPVDGTRRLSREGLGIRGIVSELKARDLAISPMTVSRALLGQGASA